MFVALRELDLGGGKRALVGEPVDVSSWSYPVLVANLNHGNIREEADPNDSDFPPEPPPELPVGNPEPPPPIVVEPPVPAPAPAAPEAKAPQIQKLTKAQKRALRGN